jgi:hypothetical protein
MERQHVNFVIILERAELDPGDYADPEALPRLTRRWNSSDSVVVSECECLQAAACGSFDYCLWCESPV